MRAEESLKCKLMKLKEGCDWINVGTGFAGINTYQGQFCLEFLHENPAIKPYIYGIKEEAGFEQDDERIITFTSEKEKCDYALSYATVLDFFGNKKRPQLVKNCGTRLKII